LDTDTGEVEPCAEASKGGFDKVKFAGGNATGDEQHVGFESLREGSVEGFGGVNGGGKDDGFSAGVGDECGEHRCIGIANFAVAGDGINGNKFVAGGENGYARTNVHIELCIPAGGGEGDLGGSEIGAGGELFVAATRLRTFGNDIFPGVDGAGRNESDAATRNVGGFFHVLEHDDAVGIGGDGCAGHDFPCFAFGQRTGWFLACMCRAGDGKREMRGGFSRSASIAIASGARKGRLVVVSCDGRGEDAAIGVRESDALGTRRV